MNKKLLWIGLVVALLVGIAGLSAYQAGLFGGQEETVTGGMPVPGQEAVEESVVTSGMPVPGYECIQETIVITE